MITQTACAAGPWSDKETRKVKGFNKIEVGGLVNVRVQQGVKAEVRVSAYGIPMSDIITDVNANTLLVTTKGLHSGESISINVTYTELVAVKTSGAATIKTNGILQSDSLKVEISGAGDANLELDVNQLSVDMRGNGNLKLSGHVVAQTPVSHGGGGSLNNYGLKISGTEN